MAISDIGSGAGFAHISSGERENVAQALGDAQRSMTGFKAFEPQTSENFIEMVKTMHETLLTLQESLQGVPELSNGQKAVLKSVYGDMRDVYDTNLQRLEQDGVEFSMREGRDAAAFLNDFAIAAPDMVQHDAWLKVPAVE